MKRSMFVNRSFISFLLVFAALNFAFIEGTQVEPADETDFFESDFDGVWAGMIQLGELRVPAVLNLNARDEDVFGVLLIVKDVESTLEEFQVLALTIDRFKKNKLNFTVAVPVKEDDDDSDDDDGVEDVQFRSKLKNGVLTLKVKSQEFGNSKTDFLQLTAKEPVQGIWLGDNKGDPVILDLVRNGDDLEGSGQINGDDGELANGLFTGNRLTGSLEGSDETLGNIDLKYKSRKQMLKGRIQDTSSGSIKTKVFPVGGNGKRLKGQNSTPDEVTLEGSAVPAARFLLSISGKNLQPGSVAHLNNSRIAITSSFVTDNKTMMVGIDVPMDTADGTKVSLLIVGPDNQQAEIKDAFTVRVSTDDDDDGDDDGPVAVSFINDVQPIFVDNCMGCHVNGSEGGFTMDAVNAWNDIVNQPSTAGFDYIEPNNPDDSYIIMKLRGDSRIFGSRMPRNRAPLSDDLINTIVEWVNDGAPNN